LTKPHQDPAWRKDVAVAGTNKTIVRAGFEALYYSGAYRLLQPVTAGIGVILTLHHVRPARDGAFQPNRLLEVTPEFLDEAIARVRAAGLETVSIDEVHRRLVSGDHGKRFVCFTVDDAYRDIAQWAHPIFERHGVPYALYVPTRFPDGAGELWWVALETVIARAERVTLTMEGAEKSFSCASTEEKWATYDTIYWWLRSLPTETALRAAVADLARAHGVDMAELCRDLCMSWEEIGALAADPLVTIGAHTVNHVMLGKVPAEAVRAEMADGVAQIEARLGVQARHFAYPVGDRVAAGPREFATAGALGFKTAVTTRPGVLFPEHRAHLMALPRISLNGEFQHRRYLDVLLSGAATALWTRFRRVDAA
jgi:peptidoglycan/xylan/chitin deacetylase (PgdA/CDA1 family)